MFWKKEPRRDFTQEQKEADKLLAVEQSKYIKNREEFHNVKAMVGADIIGSYIEQLYIQRRRN